MAKKGVVLAQSKSRPEMLWWDLKRAVHKQNWTAISNVIKKSGTKFL